MEHGIDATVSADASSGPRLRDDCTVSGSLARAAAASRVRIFTTAFRDNFPSYIRLACCIQSL